MMGPEFTKLQDLDIVCGRGKSYDSFPGNVIFKRLVRQHSEVYRDRERLQKAVVIQQIAKQLQASNIRFVKRAFQGRWVLLNDEEISIKIGHALRDVRTVSRRQARKAEQKRRASPPGDGLGGGEEGHSSGSSSLEQSSGSSTSTSPFPTDPTSTAQQHMPSNPTVLDNIARGETPSALASNEVRAAVSYVAPPASLAAAAIPMPTIWEQHQLSLMNTMCAYPLMPASPTPIFWNTLPTPYFQANSSHQGRQASRIATIEEDSSRPLDLRASASWEERFTLDDVADILDACCDDEAEEHEQGKEERKGEDEAVEQEQQQEQQAAEYAEV